MALLLRPGPFLGEGAAVPPSDRRGRPIPGPGAGTAAGEMPVAVFPPSLQELGGYRPGRGASQGQRVTAKPGARLPDAQSLPLQEHSSEI